LQNPKKKRKNGTNTTRISRKKNKFFKTSKEPPAAAGGFFDKKKISAIKKSILLLRQTDWADSDRKSNLKNRTIHNEIQIAQDVLQKKENMIYFKRTQSGLMKRLCFEGQGLIFLLEQRKR
jgi:hypothetical protein